MGRTPRKWQQYVTSRGHEETTFLIIDAQTVKNADTAMEKGYDAGKKVAVSSGI